MKLRDIFDATLGRILLPAAPVTAYAKELWQTGAALFFRNEANDADVEVLTDQHFDQPGGVPQLDSSGKLSSSKIVGAVSYLPGPHAAQHGAGSSDALAWTSVHGYGLESALPSASASNAGYFYFASDTGKLWRSNGTSWDETVANAAVTIPASDFAFEQLDHTANPSTSGGETSDTGTTRRMFDLTSVLERVTFKGLIYAYELDSGGTQTRDRYEWMLNDAWLTYAGSTPTHLNIGFTRSKRLAFGATAWQEAVSGTLSATTGTITVSLTDSYNTILSWNGEELVQVKGAISGTDVNVTFKAFRKFASSSGAYANGFVILTQHRSTYQTVR